MKICGQLVFCSSAKIPNFPAREIKILNCRSLEKLTHPVFYLYEIKTQISQNVSINSWFHWNLPNKLILSWRRPLSYRNQSIDLPRKLMDWFLYNNGLCHERVKPSVHTFYLKWTTLDFLHYLVVKLFIMGFPFSDCVAKAYCVIAWVRYVSLFG